ncbi:HAD family hydrolase [Desulfobacca acetoxidans]|uniref:phosphoglycolate phosphatase n=1 Tax=Desulfobacca acetoxidans (strain ATCC 700848 / DSM 11109 / ASRB2) TaxID=880072 RepID=F2NJG7_DESAR|nr:HAD family hydrolase [Desulfobacca acetoxidans]AEB09479.1 HAD-superfamily hydrolase, subfamily IA, variant 3 [Desulfobacca acetoxidans DSM 11109]
MKLKVVAFDCDGVLFDSRASNITFYNHILKYFQRPPMGESAVDYVHAHTVYESLAYIFPDHPDLEEVIRYCRSLDYGQFIPLMLQEPHLIEFLQFLRPQFGTAVATNRTTTTKAVFEHHRLRDYFDIIISAQDVAHPKPHPESFLRIFHYFGIEPEEAIYFGDSLVDQEFARNCGVKLVAFRNPRLEADYYLDSFAQGPELIRHLID